MSLRRASGPAAEKPLEGLGFPIHLLPSVRDEVHKKPKASLMKMIKQALKKSKKVDAKKKASDSSKKAEKKEEEIAEAKAASNPEKAKKLEQESKVLKETAKKAEEGGVAGAKDEGSRGN